MFLVNSLIYKAKNIYNNAFTGHKRSIKAKINIIYILLLKGISTVIGLAFVPLVLNYIDAERYGIWLTLSSIMGWFYLFDIGLGNGLRNRFTEAIAKNDVSLAKTYVSTTYFVLSSISIILLVLFYFINPLLNWQKILNTIIVDSKELSFIVEIVFTVFIFQFVFKLITSILLADQRPAISSSLSTYGNILALCIIIYLVNTTKGSLINLAIVLSLSPLIIYICATFYLFITKYRVYAPSFKYINLKNSKDLVGMGLKFFIIQIAAVIFFSLTNIFIAQYVDLKTVAAYNIAYKYIGVALMIYGIILTPIWSAVTDAYARSDYNWLKNALKKLNKFSVLTVILLLVLLIISPYVYNTWIGNSIHIPFSLSLIVTLYIVTKVVLSPFSAYVNGFGKLKLSLYVLIIQIIFYVPLAMFLGSKFGAMGIISSMILVNLTSLFQEPIQVYKIINKTADGIWNK